HVMLNEFHSVNANAYFTSNKIVAIVVAFFWEDYLTPIASNPGKSSFMPSLRW
ncbi:hypothetical protein Tco_0460225, partial [Tanacetum coccineum]